MLNHYFHGARFDAVELEAAARVDTSGVRRGDIASTSAVAEAVKTIPATEEGRAVLAQRSDTTHACESAQRFTVACRTAAGAPGGHG
jgi:hypothetical protein